MKSNLAGGSGFHYLWAAALDWEVVYGRGECSWQICLRYFPSPSAAAVAVTRLVWWWRICGVQPRLLGALFHWWRLRVRRDLRCFQLWRWLALLLQSQLWLRLQSQFGVGACWRCWVGLGASTCTLLLGHPSTFLFTKVDIASGVSAVWAVSARTSCRQLLRYVNGMSLTPPPHLFIISPRHNRYSRHRG